MATIRTLRFLYCFIGRYHSLGKISLMPQLAKYIRLHVRTPCKKNQDFYFFSSFNDDWHQTIYFLPLVLTPTRYLFAQKIVCVGRQKYMVTSSFL